MRITKATLILFFIISSYDVKSQESDTLKYWCSNCKLVWSDFKGKVPSSESQSNTMAICAYDIIVSPLNENSILNYNVEVVFFKNQAWTKDTSRYALAHEQLHFDIAELYARKLRKAIKELRKREIEDFRVIIESLLAEESKMQDDYDNETAHGIYTRHQLEWAKKIAKELELLKMYSSDLEINHRPKTPSSR